MYGLNAEEQENSIDDHDDSSDSNTSIVDVINAEHVVSINTVGSDTFLITLPVPVMKHHKHKFKLNCKIDSGTDVSIMSKSTYRKLTNDHELKHLKPPTCTMRVYGGETLKNLGHFVPYAHARQKQHSVVGVVFSSM